MYIKELRQLVREMYGEDVIFFGMDDGGDCYDRSIVGITEDNRLVYDADSIIEELVHDNEWTEEEAADWYGYNVVRSLPYAGEGAPILINNFSMVYEDVAWIINKNKKTES